MVTIRLGGWEVNPWRLGSQPLAVGADPVSKVYQLDLTGQDKQRHTFPADLKTVVGENPFPGVEGDLQYEIFYACSNGKMSSMPCTSEGQGGGICRHTTVSFISMAPCLGQWLPQRFCCRTCAT
jgi:hypothetical protein